jgi:hypothetical protein
MGAEEEFPKPGHDEAVLAWAEDYEQAAYESLVQHIGETSIELTENIFKKRDSSPESFAKLGKFCRLLSRQAQFLSGSKTSNYFRN